MALLNTYVVSYGQIKNLLEKIQEGEAPDKFTREYLKDLGFKSSNMYTAIPLLKGIGFLSTDGTPTKKYHEYRDQSNSRTVLGEALREAYSDLFKIKSYPKKEDLASIKGKFKSAFNTNDRNAGLMASTFYALLECADVDVKSTSAVTTKKAEPKSDETEKNDASIVGKKKHGIGTLDLAYNIQIHLPPTKDIEVYNSIFKALKEHLLD